MSKENLYVEHDYADGCSDSNFHSGEPRTEYDSVSDFLEDYDDNDIALNLVFRWDILKDEDTGHMSAMIFIMYQRKGIFDPIVIKNISESDFEKLGSYLKKHWKYLKEIWEPISETKI